MPPAARVGDLHACPSATHVGGPVAIGSATVKIGGAAAARVGDQASCKGASDTLSQGSPTVFIEGRPAARAGDSSLHAGTILTGCDTVNIGNSSYAGGVGGTAAGGGKAGTDDVAANAADPAAANAVKVNGKTASPQLLSSIVTIARGVASGGTEPSSLGALATALEVAMARNDFSAIQNSASGIQEILQKARNKKTEPAEGEAEEDGEKPKDAAAPAATPAWDQPVLADPPKRIIVRNGRVEVNGHYVGLHAISEFDLIGLQAADQTFQVIQRLGVASAAGRNCARIFCMYKDVHGELSPLTTPGYWASVDIVVKRLIAYGMIPELVLFADCERRADGTGGVMPSWDARLAFAREAGQVLKGKPVIVNGMDEPYRNGAAAADDPRLLEVMTAFREASGHTIPFSVGDPQRAAGVSIESVRGTLQTLAATGAALIVMHDNGDTAPGKPYRAWIDRLAELDTLRAGLQGDPYLYHNQPMGFASRAERARRDDDAEAAVAAACLCAIRQMGFCYHRVAIEDAATPGLELTRVATLIPQSPEFRPVAIGDSDGPIARYDTRDNPGGGFAACSDGRETWAVMYGKEVAHNPRVEWRRGTPQVIWQGDRVVLWRAS